MKKLFSFFAIIFGLLLLSGCRQKLTVSDFDSISKNMTEKEVINVLGKPYKTINDQKEIENKVSKELKISTYVLSLNDEKTKGYNKLYEMAKSYFVLKDTLSQRKYTIKVIQYKYKDNENKTQIKDLYFYSGKLYIK